MNNLIELKNRLKDDVVILAHHYVNDDVIAVSDYQGDSLELAKIARTLHQKYIIFCGVKFMAETADIVTRKDQVVLLPVLHAGCDMADMAPIDEVEKAWKRLTSLCGDVFTPVSYVNSSADLKSFIGSHRGIICTSANAKKIITWALQQNEKVFFLPDQNLGRNTCFELGIALTDMLLLTPNSTDEEIRNAKVILWDGCCPVHQGFDVEKVNSFGEVLIHPECDFKNAFDSQIRGSTSAIIKNIKNRGPSNDTIFIGTEANLVNRLIKNFPHLNIQHIDTEHFCSSMNLITSVDVFDCLQSIASGNPINVVKVDDDVKENALLALNRMFEV